MIDIVRHGGCLWLLSAAVSMCAMAQVGAQSDSARPAAPASTDVPANIPKYEVATIKPSPASSEGMLRFMFTPDGTEISGVPLQMIVREAFHVEDDRIAGLPGWAKTDRFDIQAKVAPEDAPKLEKLKMEQRVSMLVPVLEERFNLKYHHEMRELPSYALVVANGGPKLKQSSVPDLPPDGNPPPAGDHDHMTTGGPGGAAKLGPGPNPHQGHFVRMMGPGHIEATGVDLQPLVRTLSQSLGRTVVDKTGLSGNYDYALNWTPDNGPPPALKGAPPGDESLPDPVGPSLFTALQEQLGLKLESAKGMVDVIVIDHIEPPSPN